MSIRPMGPRSKSSRPVAPPLSISSNGSQPPDPLATAQQSHYANNAQLLSPSDTPRFNGPIPTLGTPVPKSRGGDGSSRPSLGKLNINPGMAGSVPLFQHVAGPQRIDDVDDGTSTLSPEVLTIRPHETYSSPGQNSGRSNESGAASSGEQMNGYGYAGKAMDPLSGLREAVDKLFIGTSSSSQPSIPNPISSPPTNPPAPSNASSTSIPALPLPKPKDFSDAVLEDLARVGEGAGGAVHKVRDRRDGMVYARKTITTREVAMKQVVRELNIISTTQHVNIVQCFGAYMSPSSSEVKIMMEFCDGGSLEAIGKKIKEIGAVVGEKIAGRLAEGVSDSL